MKASSLDSDKPVSLEEGHPGVTAQPRGRLQAQSYGRMAAATSKMSVVVGTEWEPGSGGVGGQAPSHYLLLLLDFLGQEDPATGR